MRLRASRRATRHTATRALVNDAHRREMTYFEALGEALRDLLEPAAVGATKVTTKGPKNSALADADVTVDVNGAARAIAVDAKQTFELPIDGVKLVAKANHHGDLSADVVASGLALSGLDVAVEGLARDTANATIGAKLAIDSVGITADSALAGGDIVASACYAFDDNTALGAKATVSPSSGGLADWTLAAQRRDGPTTLSAALSDGGNTVALGVTSELDAKTTAGLEAKLAMGGERNSLSYALGVSKTLQSGDTMRVVHSNHGDTDVTYTTTLCEGAIATGCLRMASKGHHYKTGFSVAMGQ
tara:strand:+ start:1 stop:909 length:909 start_codon:yes stop_codon:yes gene_type:complete